MNLYVAAINLGAKSLIDSFSQVTNPGQLGNGLRGFNVQPTYGGVKDVFRSVYSEGGVRSLYRGVGIITPYIMHLIFVWGKR